MKTDMTTLVRRRQHGAALAVALVLLLILTLLGVTGSKTTIMEERMAGNFRDRQVAFEAAEAALRVAEARLLDNTTFSAMQWDGTDGTHDANPSLDPFDVYGPSSTVTTVSVTDSTIVAESSQNPEYYIERLPSIAMAGSSLVKGYTTGPPTTRFFRVTSRSFGKSGNAQAILQSTVF